MYIPVMTFTQDNIRYCLLSFDLYQKQFQEQFTKHNPAISGLFQWHKVFNGSMDFPRTAEQFSKYNVIHVNITPRNLFEFARIVPLIRKAKAKLLVNVDYAIELWLSNFNYPELFLQELDKADYIFAVEERMADLLSMQLKRNVACIPHPSDVEGIGNLATKERNQMIGVNVHRYDKNYLLPWFALNNLPAINRSEILTCVMGGCFKPDEVLHLYDSYVEHVPFPEMMSITSKFLFAIDSYSIHSYGRYSVECAALAVPCVGSDKVSSIRRLWPDLAIPTNDIKAMHRVVVQLLNDFSFYAHTVEKAQELVSFYSFDSCRKMMLDFLNSPQ